MVSRPRFQQLRLAFAMAVAGSVLGLLVAAFAIPALPVSREAEATIGVIPRAGEDAGAPGLPDEAVPEGRVAPWIAREITMIGGAQARQRVIERLQGAGCGQVDPEQIRRTLEQDMTVATMRGTAVVAIRVRHRDGEYASRLVRELLGVYWERRAEMEEQEAERLARELSVALPAREEQVRLCQADLEAVERAGLKNLDLGGTHTLLHIPESKKHRDARLALEDAEAALRELQKRRVLIDPTGWYRYRLLRLDQHPITVAKTPSAAVWILTAGTVAGLILSQVIALPWLLAKARRGRKSRAGGLTV